MNENGSNFVPGALDIFIHSYSYPIWGRASLILSGTAGKSSGVELIVRCTTSVLSPGLWNREDLAIPNPNVGEGKGEIWMAVLHRF